MGGNVVLRGRDVVQRKEKRCSVLLVLLTLFLFFFEKALSWFVVRADPRIRLII